VQGLCLLLAFLALSVASRLPLPPTLPDMEVVYWLEVPAAILLAVKFNELSGLLPSVFAPAAAANSRSM